MKVFLLFILLFLFTGSSKVLEGPVLVFIGNINNTQIIQNETELFNIMAQQQIYWNDNDRIQIVAYNDGRYLNKLFYKKIKRNNNFFQVIWIENKYLGIGNEPIYLDTEEEVIEYIKSNPNSFGFITDESMESGLKILYQF